MERVETELVLENVEISHISSDSATGAMWLVAAVGWSEFQSHTEQPDRAVEFELAEQVQCGVP